MPINKAITKRILFQVLDKLPASVGFSLYHRLQNLLEVRKLTGKIKSGNSTFNSLERITDKLGLSIYGKVILEIGSGWLPILPYFFLYKGKAKKVLTFDLNRHYQQNNIRKLNVAFEKLLEEKIIETDGDYSLPKGVHYFPGTDVSQGEIASADLVFSRFVLEHVTPEALEQMHRYLKEQLRPGSHIIHFISPSDHRAYDDPSLSLQDFLRYSKEEWDDIQTKFDYHNRWRLPQYVNLFKKLGFEIVHLEYDCPARDSEVYKKFKSLPLHADFKYFSEEELTAGSINIVLKL